MCLGTLNPLFSPKSQTVSWGQAPRVHGEGWGTENVKKASQVWGLRWEEREEGVPSKETEKTKAEGWGQRERSEVQPQHGPQLSRWSSFRMAPGPPPSMACGLPELPWTFPATGPNPVLSHQQFPEEQIFIVLGRKKKSPLLGSGSGNCY